MRSSPALAWMLALGCGNRAAHSVKPWGLEASVPGNGLSASPAHEGHPPPTGTSSVHTMQVEGNGPMGWAHSDSGQRIVMQVGSDYVVLRASDFAVIAQVDARLALQQTNTCRRSLTLQTESGELAWVTRDGEVRSWNITAPDEPRTLASHRKVRPFCAKLTFAPDGNQLAVADSQGLLMYDTQLSRERWSAPRPSPRRPRYFVPPDNEGIPQALGFFSNGTRLRAAWSFMGMSLFATDGGKKLAGPYGYWRGFWDEPDSVHWELDWADGSPRRLDLLTLKTSRSIASACSNDFRPLVVLGDTLLGCSASGARAKVVDLTKNNVVVVLTLENDPSDDQGYRGPPELTAQPYVDDLRLTSDQRGIVASLQYADTSPDAAPHTRLFSVPDAHLVADLGRATALGRAGDGRLFYINLQSREFIVIGAGPSVRRFSLPAMASDPHDSSNASKMKITATISHDGSIVALASDAQPYILATNSGSVALLQGLPVLPLQSSEEHVTPMIAFSFAADDTRLFAIAQREQAAAVWELPSGRTLFIVRGRPSSPNQ